MTIQFEDLEEWMRLDDEQEDEILLEFDQAIFDLRPAISSVKTEKEDIVEDTRRLAAGYVETVDCEVRKLVSSKKQLHLDIDHMVKQVALHKKCIEEARRNSEALSQEILSLKARKEVKVNELKEKRKRFKEKFDAHVIAMGYYKRNLQCYLDFEDEDWNICTFYFFRTSSDSSTKDYFVKLSHTNGAWELLAMTPQLPSFHELQENLKITNDIQGFIARVREDFKLIKEADGRE
ncbi:uncharacterized protein [Anabrus simplex]|uniref:uncharacterized protein n=1 Tax=Anabrus simplex TaxID=316456 RepID=UPI0034DD8EBE